jgi:hypothetical protein
MGISLVTMRRQHKKVNWWGIAMKIPKEDSIQIGFPAAVMGSSNLKGIIPSLNLLFSGPDMCTFRHSRAKL